MAWEQTIAFTYPWGFEDVSVPRFIPVTVLHWRDANASAGTWPEVVTLAHETVIESGLEVPLFEGDPERLAWRRRKWWGRGPIVPWLWCAPLDEKLRRRRYGGPWPRCQCRTPWCDGYCPPF